MKCYSCECTNGFTKLTHDEAAARQIGLFDEALPRVLKLRQRGPRKRWVDRQCDCNYPIPCDREAIAKRVKGYIESRGFVNVAVTLNMGWMTAEFENALDNPNP